MADLYGRLKGDRGPATRCGSRKSGLRTTAETWKGQVRVDLEADGSFTIIVGPKGGGTFDAVVLHGNCDSANRHVTVGGTRYEPVERQREHV